MRRKRGQDQKIDLADFDNPYTALATMILIQAKVDYELLGDRENKIMDGEPVSKYGIIKFFRSRWAWHLATSCGLEPKEIRERGILLWQGRTV